ncbi:hypothetical protein VCHC47A1_2999, partial [Vibrio cholerae HC-47A1]
MGRNRVFIT